MRRDLFTPQQFPLSCCLKGSEMSLGTKAQAQVTLERKHTQDFVSYQTKHVSAAVCSLSCKKWISEFAFAALSRALTLYYWLLAALKFFYYLGP